MVSESLVALYIGCYQAQLGTARHSPSWLRGNASAAPSLAYCSQTVLNCGVALRLLPGELLVILSS